MKIICKRKVIDLPKFETVRYRESLLGSSEGYPVEAIRYEASRGIFGGQITVAEEIVRFKDEEDSQKLTGVIAEKWVTGEDAFNVDEWIREVKK